MCIYPEDKRNREDRTEKESIPSTNQEQAKEVRNFQPFVEANVGPTISDSTPTTSQEKEKEVEDFKQFGNNASYSPLLFFLS